MTLLFYERRLSDAFSSKGSLDAKISIYFTPAPAQSHPKNYLIKRLHLIGIFEIFRNYTKFAILALKVDMGSPGMQKRIITYTRDLSQDPFHSSLTHSYLS